MTIANKLSSHKNVQIRALSFGYKFANDNVGHGRATPSSRWSLGRS